MFGQMSVDSECDHAIDTFERSRVVDAGSPESCIDVDLVEMAYTSLVFLKVTLGSKTHSASITPEGPLKIVDIHMKPQL